jgi:hypothetical protein
MPFPSYFITLLLLFKLLFNFHGLGSFSVSELVLEESRLQTFIAFPLYWVERKVFAFSKIRRKQSKEFLQGRN